MHSELCKVNYPDVNNLNNLSATWKSSEYEQDAGCANPKRTFFSVCLDVRTSEDTSWWDKHTNRDNRDY